MKFCISYSCGKDSTLALYRMINQGHEPIALIVAVDESCYRSWFHGVSINVLNEVSQSLGIPLICCNSNAQNYEEKFVESLKIARDMGAKCCVFGDIDIDEHKKWGEDKCEKADIAAVYPLWLENRVDITNNFIDAGFKAIIKSVTKKYNMSQDYLGKVLTHSVIEEFALLGIDVCGENGEYHTFCYDGPIFKKPVLFSGKGIYESPYSFSLYI